MGATKGYKSSYRGEYMYGIEPVLRNGTGDKARESNLKINGRKILRKTCNIYIVIE